MSESATAINEAYYDEFWQSCPDFSRYNPGALHRRRAIVRLLSRCNYRSLLDAGCGNGELLLFLRAFVPEGVELWGADLSSETVRENAERHPYATFSVLNLEEKALDRQFGVVICTEVVEHLDDRPRAIENLAKMVEPGGHLIITCPTAKVHATEKHFGHISHPTPSELERDLRRAGMEVDELENWGFPLYTAMKYATNVRPDWALKNFAAGEYSPTAKLVSKALYYANFLNLPSSRHGCQLFVLARRPS